MENPYKPPPGVRVVPPGEAMNSHYMRKDANFLWSPDLTVRPKKLHPTFNQGTIPNFGWKGKHNTVHLYAQELAVFYGELTPWLSAAILIQAVDESAKKNNLEWDHNLKRYVQKRRK